MNGMKRKVGRKVGRKEGRQGGRKEGMEGRSASVMKEGMERREGRNERNGRNESSIGVSKGKEGRKEGT
jgi:hypothetical protein